MSITPITNEYEKAVRFCELGERLAFEANNSPPYILPAVLARWFYSANAQWVKEFSESAAQAKAENKMKAGRNTICGMEIDLKDRLSRFERKIKEKYG